MMRSIGGDGMAEAWVDRNGRYIISGLAIMSTSQRKALGAHYAVGAGMDRRIGRHAGPASG
jgi:hypothetical protein